MAKNEYERYAYLDRLSTEQLEALLCADIESSESHDTDVIFHILEVIATREEEHPTGRLPDEDKAWAEFQQYYNIPEGEGQSLYPCERTEDRSEQTKPPLSVPVVVRPHRLLRIAIVAAVTMMVLFGGMIAAQAAGIDVFGALGHWTETTFRFISTDARATSSGSSEVVPDLVRSEFYEAVQSALEQCGITERLAPTWYPDGFEASEPEILSDYESDSVYVSFSDNDGRFFSIDIIKHHLASGIDSHIFEKDNTPVEQYSSGVKTFYIMENIDTVTATWSDGQVMMTIGGNISTEESKAIIDSIGGKVN